MFALLCGSISPEFMSHPGLFDAGEGVGCFYFSFVEGFINFLVNITGVRRNASFSHPSCF